MNNTSQQHNTGFAMLFSVLIVSLMLTLAIGIASITFKQNILSGLAKDSGIAFYQADSGVECGKYYDVQLFEFVSPMNIENAPDTITCGNLTLTLDPDPLVSWTDHFLYTQVLPPNEAHKPCFSVVFDKKIGTNGDLISTVQGNGYNYCDGGTRQVQRSLEFIY